MSKQVQVMFIGSPGSGKSTLMQILKNAIKNNPNIVITRSTNRKDKEFVECLDLKTMFNPVPGDKK